MKKIIGILTFILVVIFSSAFIFDSVNSKSQPKLTVKDFMPSKPMIKVFNGDFENSGRVDVIDKIVKNKYQVKSVNFGTGRASVYEPTKKELKRIYSHETEKFEKNYLSKKPNSNSIILKEPLKKGTKWKNEYGGINEITGVNVNIKTPYGKYKTIEVTYTSGDYESKDYYAKGIGLVKTESLGFGSEIIEIDYNKDLINNQKDLFELLKKVKNK